MPLAAYARQARAYAGLRRKRHHNVMADSSAFFPGTAWRRKLAEAAQDFEGDLRARIQARDQLLQMLDRFGTGQGFIIETDHDVAVMQSSPAGGRGPFHCAE